MSAHRESPAGLRGTGSLAPLIAVLATVAALVAVILLVVGDSGFAAAVAVLVVILVAAGAFDALVARRKLARHHDDIGALDADEGDAVPTMAIDEDAPLGATREAHTDVDVHDLPPEHPSRETIEGQDTGKTRRP